MGEAADVRVWVWILLLGCLIAGVLNGFQVTGVGAQSAFVGPDPQVIPRDALRLRIIANSNSPADQHLKRVVRDRVIALIGRRMVGITTPAAAKAELIRSIPAVEALAEDVIRHYDAHYGAVTTVGPAEFPTKLYGDRVYPAGVYQALRITLGRGAGQNWWCVLFPPLCFVALTDGDAIAATSAFPDYPPLAVRMITEPDGKKIPVALRLATLDYGEQFVKWFAAEWTTLWHQNG